MDYSYEVIILLLVIITFIISDLECEILVCLFSIEAMFFWLFIN